MKWKVRRNNKGLPLVLWEIEKGEEYNSTDFFKDVEEFRLDAVTLYGYPDKNTLYVFGLETHTIQNFSSFPLGTIFVVKEEQL